MKKKLLFILPFVFFLTGCATYGFQKGPSPYNQGYVVSRYGRVIPEYTIGKDNSVPTEEEAARMRFKRRKPKVEYYYKKMGYIENRFRQMFIDPPSYLIDFTIGIFKMPFRLVSDYKYNHNPTYRKKEDDRVDAEYKAEKERIKVLREKLDAYIKEDLQEEGIVAEQIAGRAKEKLSVASEVKEPVIKKPVTQEPEVVKKEVQAASLAEVKNEPAQVVTPAVSVKSKPQISSFVPSAIIIVKPVKGPSPLNVQFYGSKSFSRNGRIVAYSWDFGDGDTSSKKNPTNTYWSTTYGSRIFTATLTVTDNKGATATSSCTIEVLGQ